ncbi:MAG: hypothetical protein M3R00_03655 [Pseudomonadota bacterium]|nr:hypothetical protein [Pseudomonadota bacterium]
MHKPDTSSIEQQLTVFQQIAIQQGKDFFVKLTQFELRATGLMAAISALITDIYQPLHSTVSMEGSAVLKNEDSLAAQPKVQANIDALTFETFVQKISAVVPDNAQLEQLFIEFKALMNAQMQSSLEQYKAMQKIIFAGYDISLSILDIAAIEKKVVAAESRRHIQTQIAQSMAPLDALPAGAISHTERQLINGQVQEMVAKMLGEFQPPSVAALQANNEMQEMLSAEEKNSRFTAKLTNFFGGAVNGALDLTRSLIRRDIEKEFGKHYVACLPEIGVQKSYQRVVLDILERILHIADSALSRDVQAAESDLHIQVILQRAQIDQPEDQHHAIGFALTDAYHYLHVEDHVDEYMRQGFGNIN